jgi:hypothetical protein
MPSHTPRFDRLNIAAGGTIRDAITSGRVLTSQLDRLFSVIAHHDDAQAARAVADELTARHEGVRRVFVVLFTGAHLDALTDGVGLNLAVLDAQRDYQIASTAIKVNNRSQVDPLTVYGEFLAEVVTAEDLHAGDIYTLRRPALRLRQARPRRLPRQGRLRPRHRRGPPPPRRPRPGPTARRRAHRRPHRRPRRPSLPHRRPRCVPRAGLPHRPDPRLTQTLATRERRPRPVG